MSHLDGHADLHTITVDRNVFPVTTTSYTLVQMVEKTHEKSNKVRSSSEQMVNPKMPQHFDKPKFIINTRVKDLIATDRACS